MNVSIQPMPEYAEILANCVEFEIPALKQASVGIVIAVNNASHGEPVRSKRTRPSKEATRHPAEQAIKCLTRYEMLVSKQDNEKDNQAEEKS